MNSTPIIESIFAGGPKSITDSRGTWISSIYRDPVTGPIAVTGTGLAGDKVAQPYHGGPGAEICVHLLDHYRFWNERYGLSLKAGFVGENFTLDKITEDEVCVGDILRAGTSLVQVSGPRVPCANLARRIGRPDWVKLTVTENRTGFYLRVLEPGVVQPGDAWVLQERPNPKGAIPAINRCMYLNFDPAYADLMQGMSGLGDWWKEQALEKQSRLTSHWTSSMKD